MQGAGVVHGGQDSVELDGRVQPILHLLDRLDQQGNPTQGEELALERDEHPVRCRKGVDGQQAERGLAVDQDDVVLVADLAQHPGEDCFTGDLVDEMHLRRREVDVRRDDVEVRIVRVDDGLDRVLHGPEKQVVDRRDVVRLHSEPGGERTLRIEVDHQYTPAEFGQCCPQVDGGRRLADAALLVAEGDDACGSVALQNRRFCEGSQRPASGALDRCFHARQHRRIIPVHCHGSTVRCRFWELLPPRERRAWFASTRG